MTEVEYNFGNKTMTVGYDSLGITKITRECLESLIEKQIPKKPLKVNDYLNCPTCSSLVGESKGIKCYLHNCGICGQRIDWSVEEIF